ncbi:MAG TPA: 23S rRNA (pseudouridine(1915)-N(3))-methyltransferase RlmH [Longimicrobiales bacterium]|nr:23S rRNA (pseudouridine(1915)-N(3))-methyltransferase RlmH [Longimicrobiales bacterium]
MKVVVAAVGRPDKLLLPAIREYETRAGRYWKLETTEVRPERAAQGRPVTDVRRREGERLRIAIPPGAEIIVVTRAGEPWPSERLARYLGELALRGSPGAAFLIGGAFGLDRTLFKDAAYQLSLSPMTLPHDFARLVLAEQLYRAGTIARGEPYHKG